MNLVSRSMKNLLRLYGRSALMIAVLSIVVILSVIGFTVKEGAEQSIRKIRNEAGNQVQLYPDSSFEKNELTDEIAKSVLTEDVGDYDFFMGDSVSIDLPGLEDFVFATVNMHGKELPVNGSILTSQKPDRIENFANGNWKVVDGRFYNEEEMKKGSPVVVIDENMAKHAKLKVGDTFKVHLISIDAVKEVKVVGIFRQNAETSQNPLAMLYAPYGFLKNAKEESGQKDLTIAYATFYLKDANYIDRFIKQGEEKLGTDHYYFVSNDIMLKPLLAPLENMKSFAELTIKSVLIAGAAIMILIMAVAARERKKEIGVLRSLGFRKPTIVCQLIAESLVITVLALAIGLGVGHAAAGTVNGQLMKHEIAANDQLQASMQGFDWSAQGLQAVDSSLDASTYLLIVLMGLLITTAGTVTASYMIVRYEPIKILASDK
ncbi:ABC transporter permease [Brevibacillus sp. B_LB10_24]|uniref:ABC transporter permease n=1 Tax=Brevibacillus sp. B_LB10_24 TaxID=3380645 RepID=UPI0038BB3C62